jgi:protein SCO1/2
MSDALAIKRPNHPAITRRALPFLLVAIIAIAGLAALLVPHSTASAPALVGTILTPRPAPPIRLHDQHGRTISLRQFRGRPVILTFMQATCTQLCPVVTDTIRRSVIELGKGGRRIVIVAVSADPEHDTPAAVRKYSIKHGLYDRWYYLTGRRAQLSPIWHAYYLYVAPPDAPQAVRNAHTSATYLIDAQGRERVLFGGDPDGNDLEHDLQILAGLPVKPVGVSALPAPQVGHPAPGFVLPGLDGGSVRLSSLHGKVVLLNFWATWCHPCRTEAPRLAGWYQRLRRHGLVVLGVDQQEGQSTVASFVRRYRLPYPIVLDGDGEAGAAYDVPGLPKSFLIDRQGIVRQVVFGVVGDTFLQRQVAPLVRETSAG